MVEIRGSIPRRPILFFKMLRKLRRRLRFDRKFIGCIDTCFIEGTMLKVIEKETWKIEIKDDVGERLKSLNEANCLLLINSINEFEIKSKLMRSFGIPFERVNGVYEEIERIFVNVKSIEIDEVRITSSLVNWMLRNRLMLRDGLLIATAKRLEVPFITSERKADLWKNAYEGVMDQKEFWERVRQI